MPQATEAALEVGFALPAQAPALAQLQAQPQALVLAAAKEMVVAETGGRWASRWQP